MAELSLKSTIVNISIQIVLMLIGMFGFFYFMLGGLNWGDSDWAIWNKRAIVICFIAITAIGVSFGGTTLKQRFSLAITCFFGILIPLWAIGGTLGFFSAVDGDTGLDYNNMWMAFDAGDFMTGVNMVLIADSIKTIFPIAILCLLVTLIIYSAMAGQWAQAILEAGAVTILMVVWAQWVFPAF